MIFKFGGVPFFRVRVFVCVEELFRVQAPKSRLQAAMTLCSQLKMLEEKSKKPVRVVGWYVYNIYIIYTCPCMTSRVYTCMLLRGILYTCNSASLHGLGLPVKLGL